MSNYKQNIKRLYGDLITHSDNDELKHIVDYNHPVAVIVPDDLNMTILHSTKVYREIEKCLQHFMFPYFVARFSYSISDFLNVDRSKIFFITAAPERTNELFNIAEYIGLVYSKAVLEISNNEMHAYGCSKEPVSDIKYREKYFIGRSSYRKINSYLRMIGYDDPMYTVYQKFTAKNGFGTSIEHRSRMLAMKKLSEVTTNNQSYYDFIVE